MKNLTIGEFAFFSLVAAFDALPFWQTKKGGQKNVYTNSKIDFSSV